MDMVRRRKPRGGLGALALGLGLGMVAKEVLHRTRGSDLQGQVTLVTGGSRGLGFLLAREFAREGCPVAICARDAAELDRARQDLTDDGADVLTAVCDVSDRAQVERMVDAVSRHFGRVDILVNNAGIIQVGPVQTMTHADYEIAMAIMFWGVVHPTLAVLPQMRERRAGRIVTITSIGGKVSVPLLVPYSCAKFAAVGFSEGLRAELAKDGISVTTIAPGLMRTGSHLNAFFKGDQERAFAYFAPSASLPGITMDAERAARQIVQATRRGEAERILSVPANVLAKFHGLFPGMTADLLGVVNRFLPGPNGDGTAAARGMEIQERLDSPVLRKVTGWGLSAAERFHQYPGPVGVAASQSPARNGS
jgi:NAD(P)-dependent dehydrogenase (short-subunit alcohol dehydrogenase family)